MTLAVLLDSVIVMVESIAQAQVSILAVYGRRPRPAGPVGVQHGGAPATRVALVGMGNEAIRHLA